MSKQVSVSIKVQQQIHQVNEDLRASLQHTLRGLPPAGLGFLVNHRKLLLKKVYAGIVQRLARGRSYKILQINHLKPGFLTNVMHRAFIEPSHVVLLLTKNHNHRQMMALRQIQKVLIPYTLIKIDCKYLTKNTSYHLQGVRAIYHFLYTLQSLDQPAGVDKIKFLRKYSFL